MDLKTTVRTQLDRVAAAACLALGALALLLGYIGISGTALAYKQLPYLISGGLLGALLVGVAATLYLSADLRDEWRKLDTLEDTLIHAIDVFESMEPVAVEREVSRAAPRRAAS
jgi:hypothetical protein